MPRKKVQDHSAGGAEMERLNALHSAMVEAAFAALENEKGNGEIKAATLNTIRQICSDAGVQPTKQQAEAMQRLYASLPKVDPELIAASSSKYSY